MQQDRQDQRNDLNTQLTAAHSEENYFADNINYLYTKLEYFDNVQETLHMHEAEKDTFEYGFNNVIIDLKKTYFQQLEALEEERNAIQSFIGDLNYQQFVLEQRIISEDAQALDASLENDRFLKVQYEEELEWLNHENASLLVPDDDGVPTVARGDLSAEDEAIFAANETRIGVVDGLISDVAG